MQIAFYVECQSFQLSPLLLLPCTFYHVSGNFVRKTNYKFVQCRTQRNQRIFNLSALFMTTQCFSFVVVFVNVFVFVLLCVCVICMSRLLVFFFHSHPHPHNKANSPYCVFVKISLRTVVCFSFFNALFSVFLNFTFFELNIVNVSKNK